MNNTLKSIAYITMPSNLRGTKEAINSINEWLENPTEVAFNNEDNNFAHIETDTKNFLFVMWNVNKGLTSGDKDTIKLKSVLNNLNSIKEYLSNISFEWFALIFANAILLFIKFPFIGYSPLIRNLFEFNNSFVFVVQLIFDVSSMVTVRDENKIKSFSKRMRYTEDMKAFIKSAEYFHTTTFGNALIQRKSISLQEGHEDDKENIELLTGSLGISNEEAIYILSLVSKYDVSIWVKRLLQYIYSNNKEEYIKSIKI